MLSEHVKLALQEWVYEPGVYGSVDAQFGSTGKGALNAALADALGNRFDAVLTNNGANAGHTHLDHNNNKVILKALPSFGVMADNLYVAPPQIYITGGAVVDPKILNNETHLVECPVIVHPNAAVITDQAKKADQTNVNSIASTGQGVGEALINKLRRQPEHTIRGAGVELKNAVFGHYVYKKGDRAFVEVPQGYSLGINSGFYPYCTSRECTIAQGLSDAGLAPQLLRGVAMSIRTYPIRVGSTSGENSGPGYSDQKRIKWSDIGVEPEITTVTGRQREVFTFSKLQFMNAVAANRPNILSLGFTDYIPKAKLSAFMGENIIAPYVKVMNELPKILMVRDGPKSSDIKLWDLCK